MALKEGVCRMEREPTEMELRVAKAVYDSGYSGLPDFGSFEEMRTAAIEVARAAISAMRDCAPQSFVVGPGICTTQDIWRAMFDAASNGP